MNTQAEARSKIDDVTIIRFLVKRMLDAAAIDARYREVASSPPKDGPNTVLDFSHVQFISSAVLNKLIVLERAIAERGGQLVLCGFARPLRDVFSVTRLDAAFEIVSDETSALAKFEQAG